MRSDHIRPTGPATAAVDLFIEGVVACTLECGVTDGGGPGGENDEPGANDEAQPVGHEYGQRGADAVPQVGVQRRRVEPTATEHGRVDAVDGGAYDAGQRSVGRTPCDDQSDVVVWRAGLPRERASDHDDGSQDDDEDEDATPDEVNHQLTDQQTGDDERTTLICSAVTDYARVRVTVGERLQQQQHAHARLPTSHDSDLQHGVCSVITTTLS